MDNNFIRKEFQGGSLEYFEGINTQGFRGIAGRYIVNEAVKQARINAAALNNAPISDLSPFKEQKEYRSVQLLPQVTEVPEMKTISLNNKSKSDSVKSAWDLKILSNNGNH
jgi:hypothetical protein